MTVTIIHFTCLFIYMGTHSPKASYKISAHKRNTWTHTEDKTFLDSNSVSVCAVTQTILHLIYFYIVACRAVTLQRPRDKKICENRF
jgi:hypothetical protein